MRREDETDEHGRRMNGGDMKGWVAWIVGVIILLGLFGTVLFYLPHGARRLPLIVFVVIAAITAAAVAVFFKRVQ